MSPKIKKVLRKSSYGCKGGARPFAAYCKKDMLEWLRLPLWPFPVTSVVIQEKGNNGNTANVLIILHYLTKLLAFMAKVVKALRIVEKRCNAFYSSEVVTRASQAPIFMIVSVTFYISLHVGTKRPVFHLSPRDGYVLFVSGCLILTAVNSSSYGWLI